MIALALLAASVAAAKPPSAIWRSSCAYCHTGSKVGPPIERYDSPEALKAIVRSGSGAMPPFHRSEISDAELDDLARWLQRRTASPTRRAR